MSLEKNKWENTDEEVVESCNRDKEIVCAKKEKGISIVEVLDIVHTSLSEIW